MDEGMRATLLAGLPEKVDHLGFVWRDVDAAVERYERLLGARFTSISNAGPFTVERDGAVQDIRMRAAMGRLGTIKLEFFQPLGPSCYQEHLDRYGEGVHHVGFDVSGVPDYVERYAELGVALTMKGELGSQGGPAGFAYFDTLAELGMLTEVVQFGSEARERTRQRLEALER